jgi:hypothetical protein
MFAVDHAATALLVKRRYPSVPLAPILVSVQAMELAWVGLNYLGIERRRRRPRFIASLMSTLLICLTHIRSALSSASRFWYG